MNITRIGKIPRLPRALRDQLNQRLQDGEQARPLAAWLNCLPEVQAILAANFGAKSINPQNLSNWRHGGYRNWLHHQQALEFARSFTEDARELQASATSPSPGLPAIAALATEGSPAIAPKATGGLPSVVPLTKEGLPSIVLQTKEGPPLTHLLSVWLATRYALATRALDAADPKHWRQLRELCSDVVKLRHGDHTAERLRLNRQRLAAHDQQGETRESDRIRLNPTFESNLNSQPSRNTVSPNTMNITGTSKIARLPHRHARPPEGSLAPHEEIRIAHISSEPCGHRPTTEAHSLLRNAVALANIAKS